MLKTWPQNKEQCPKPRDYLSIMSKSDKNSPFGSNKSGFEPRSLGDIIANPRTRFGKLAKEAERRVALADQLRNSLPENLRDGISDCNISDSGTLTVLAVNPEWASRLRFETELLLSIGRQAEPGLSNVKIKVAGPGV